MSFNVGENVGPYRIIEQLGQGGMATVYKAYHAALDRYVAIKALHPAFGEDQNFLARFQREARLVAKLEHPNIVPIYDYSEHEGRPYLVMKFIEGDTLKARLAKGPLASAEIEKIVEAVGSALAYAHKQGILHRDIKPSNVLVANDGQLYLADFGLARIAQSGESTLSSDMIMGTPQYISPEQAMGKKDLDEGTDIYSFGVMIYEMVVGQVPFNADTPFSIIHDHIYSPLPLPRSINPKVPESVERVLLKALAKERVDRYPDVTSLVSAFKEAWVSAGVPMQGTAITMRPAQLKAAGPSAKTVAAKSPVKKRTSPWPFIAGGILLVIGCLFILFVLRSDRLLKILLPQLRRRSCRCNHPSRRLRRLPRLCPTELVPLRPRRQLRELKCLQLLLHWHSSIKTRMTPIPHSICPWLIGMQAKFANQRKLCLLRPIWPGPPIHSSSAMPVTNSSNARHGFRPQRCISARSNHWDLAESLRRI